MSVFMNFPQDLVRRANVRRFFCKPYDAVVCQNTEMTRRYKGRPSRKTIVRDFPYVVEIAVPPGGQCMRFTNNGAFKLRTCRTDTPTNATICFGALPDVQSRSSSRLSSPGR